MKPLIKIDQLSAGYDNKIVLKSVNFTVEQNDFVGVIGPNGGGKTTLLKTILGQLEPIEGSILFPGLEHGTKSIGYLPQINVFDKSFPITVRDVVLSGLMGQKGLWKRYSKQDKEKALALLDDMGMFQYANRAIGQLSGGQMQRAFLCRAIVNNPKVLILDEPGTYVDKQFEGELFDKLAYLNQKMAIVLVAHDIGMISSYVKTIACVNGSLHYHSSSKISEEVLKVYNCPVELISHGNVPHRVLRKH